MFPFPSRLYLLSFKRTHDSCWGLGWGWGVGVGEAWVAGVGGGGCNRLKYTLTPRTDTPRNGNNNTTTTITNFDSVNSLKFNYVRTLHITTGRLGDSGELRWWL